MSNRTDHRAIYRNYIQTCFRYHPEARSFYDQLTHYLLSCSGGQKSSLQEVKFFEISPPSSFHNYPKRIPFLTTKLPDKQHRPRVGLLEGFPCPDCIAFLGAEFAVRPEFFIEHLPISLKKAINSGVHELPTLPSRQDNVVRVHFSRLVESPSHYLDHFGNQSSSLMHRKRVEAEHERLKYEKDLITHRKYGATHVRRVVVHDYEMYSIEEMVSFTIATQHDHWYGIFLTDRGRMIMDQTGLPWSKSSRHDRPSGIVPLVPYNLPAEQSITSPESGWDEDGLSERFDQFHPLKNVVFADDIDSQLMEEDPLFLLASVLTTSFLSWSQTLNVLAKSITECQDQLEFDQGQLQFRLGQLRQHIITINRIKGLLSENEHVIQEGGCTSWPKASSESTVKRKCLMQRQLQADYACLAGRCSQLIAQSESAISSLVSFAQLVVSEKGIMNANEVNQLTKIAAVFIPLNFITSFFGMNIREWDPYPSWKWPFGSAIILTCLTIFLLNRKRLIQRIRKSHYIAKFMRDGRR